MAMGPKAVVAKQGEYGAALFTESGFFALPGYPLEDVRDPTGAGDSFAGGFLGYLDSEGGELDDGTLRRAMGYGTVLASFNVEEFGTERVARLEPHRDRRAFRGTAIDDRRSSRMPVVAAVDLREFRLQPKRGPGEAMATEQQTKDQADGASADGARAAGDTLSVTDNRTGRDLRAARSPTGRCGRWTCATSRSPRTTSG